MTEKRELVLKGHQINAVMDAAMEAAGKQSVPSEFAGPLLVTIGKHVARSYAKTMRQRAGWSAEDERRYVADADAGMPE